MTGFQDWVQAALNDTLTQLENVKEELRGVRSYLRVIHDETHHLRVIHNEVHIIMATFDELKAELQDGINQVRQNTTTLGSVKDYLATLNSTIAGLQARIDELTSAGNGGLTAEQVQELDSGLDDLRAATQEQAAMEAILVGTPSEPVGGAPTPAEPADNGENSGNTTEPPADGEDEATPPAA